jgi:alpha-glucosidase
MDALKWWQKAVFYQIYPPSFADGNGDGMGDFQGMISRLDYLRDLGVNALWLSPHYPSPFLDCGYDISDYTDVGPEYGSLDDFKRFLDEAHSRDIRVVLDLVLNHTSDRHPWFIESRSSLDDPKRDWYVWRDSKDGGPPNNWASGFGGTAWEHDPATGQYYYHFFLKEQPDLNWRNPEVKRAMWDVVRFWLDMGVDGFRLDAIATIFEHLDLPNYTLSMSIADLARRQLKAKTDAQRRRVYDAYQKLYHFQLQQPGVHELMQELRTVVDAYSGDRVLIGEEEDVAYHGTGDDELHMVFNFPLMRVRRLTPAHIRDNQQLRLGTLPEGAWPCNTLGNHDSPRVWTRYGDGVHDAELARLHLALLLTLKGTPFLYNGEEIGMTNLELTDLSQFRDTLAVGRYRMLVDELEMTPKKALKAVADSTRDRCRSPLQWSGAPNGGFSPPDVETWLPVNPDYAEGVNVAAQEGNPASLLNFYRRMLNLRRVIPALIAGDYFVLDPQSEEYLAFLRRDPDIGQTCLVVLNFSDTEQTATFDLRVFGGEQLQLLFSSSERADRTLPPENLNFAPFEIFVAELV